MSISYQANISHPLLRSRSACIFVSKSGELKRLHLIAGANNSLQEITEFLITLNKFRTVAPDSLQIKVW